MFHIGEKENPTGVGSSSAPHPPARGTRKPLAHNFLTQKQVGRSANTNLVCLTLLLLFGLSQHRKNFFPAGNGCISSVHTVPSAATTLRNRLPQHDPGQKAQEGAVFQQQPLRDEILQPVGLAPLRPTPTRKGSSPRASDHALADSHFWRKGIFGKQHELGGSRRTSSLACAVQTKSFRNPLSSASCQQLTFPILQGHRNWDIVKSLTRDDLL